MLTRSWDDLRSAIRGRWCSRPDLATAPPSRLTTDSRDDQTDAAFLALKGDRFDGHDFLDDVTRAGARAVIVSEPPPDGALPHGVAVIAVDDTRLALQHLARNHRAQLAAVRVIAITGSAGKTTTKELVHSVLSQTLEGTCAPASFNNDIGVPLTLLSAAPKHKYVVVEIGTNGPGEIRHLGTLAQPDIAVITLVGHSHLEGLGTIEDVAAEKASLLRTLPERGTAIVTADSPVLEPHLRGHRMVIRYGVHADAELRLTSRGWEGPAGGWVEINGRDRFHCPLPGPHNAVNTLAAIAVARRLGVSDADINAGLRAHQPSPMRSEIIKRGGVHIINDAYNANPESMAAALTMLEEFHSDGEGRRLAVIGSMLELGPAGPALHRAVGERLLELIEAGSLHDVALIGRETRAIAEVLARDRSSRLRWTHHMDVDAASSGLLRDRIRPGDVILLKGSRAIGLDRLLDRLESSTSPASPTMS